MLRCDDCKNIISYEKYCESEEGEVILCDTCSRKKENREQHAPYKYILREKPVAKDSAVDRSQNVTRTCQPYEYFYMFFGGIVIIMCLRNFDNFEQTPLEFFQKHVNVYVGTFCGILHLHHAIKNSIACYISLYSLLYLADGLNLLDKIKDSIVGIIEPLNYIQMCIAFIVYDIIMMYIVKYRNCIGLISILCVVFYNVQRIV